MRFYFDRDGLMKLHFPFPRHNQTSHIAIDTRLCESCGKCVEACPVGVLGLLPFRFHRHVRVNHGELCKGCLKCVRACVQGAIRSLGNSKGTAKAATNEKS